MTDNTKKIPPELYDREYYLSDCDGFSEFLESRGKVLPDRLRYFFSIIDPRPGDRILEIGCGRGELCAALAPHSLSVNGVDYSTEAISICRETFETEHHNLRFSVADATRLPFENDNFDLVICTELLEHINPQECIEMMDEVVRVLKNDGRFIAQTEPNKLCRYFTSIWSFPFRVIGAIRRQQRARLLIERPFGHVHLHINEHTYWSIRKLVKKRFRTYRIEMKEMRRGMNKFERFIFNAYPFNNLPIMRLFFNREIVIYCQYPK